MFIFFINSNVVDLNFFSDFSKVLGVNEEQFEEMFEEENGIVLLKIVLQGKKLLLDIILKDILENIKINKLVDFVVKFELVEKIVSQEFVKKSVKKVIRLLLLVFKVVFKVVNIFV